MADIITTQQGTWTIVSVGLLVKIAQKHVTDKIADIPETCFYCSLFTKTFVIR